MKFLRIHYPTRTISLDYTIFVNKKAYQQLLNLITSQLNENEQSLILYIIGQLYNPDISQRGKQQKTKVSFYELEIKWEKILSRITTTTPTSQKTKKTDFFLTSKTDPTDVSHPHFKSGITDFGQLRVWLDQKKWDYAIWIDKSDRDHVINPVGKLNINSDLFKALIEGWDINSFNSNGWITPIKREKGLYFSLSIHKKGSIRFWKNLQLSWELFFKLFQKEVDFLNFDQYKKLIECFQEQDKKKLFYIETANLIGPKDIIDDKFKGACLVYTKTLFSGKYHSVCVKIDYSKGPPEVEFQGPEGPTKALQDITVRAFETVRSLQRFEFLIEENLDVSTSNNQALVSLQQQALSEFSETQALIKNLDLTADLRQVEVRENLIKIFSSNNEIISNLLAMNDIFENSVNQQTLDFKNELFENTENILSGQYKILDQVNGSKKELVNSISSDHQEIKKEISKIQVKLDDLNDLIESNFSNVNNQVKNALYLVLRQIHNTPDINAKMISNQLKLGQRKVYYCLKKLQDQKLILPEIKKTDLPGRPSRNFKLNYFKKVK